MEGTVSIREWMVKENGVGWYDVMVIESVIQGSGTWMGLLYIIFIYLCTFTIYYFYYIFVWARVSFSRCISLPY